MISIPKKIEYSLVLIADLARNKGRRVSLAEAAKRMKLPYRFLGQLAIPLSRAGIIEGKEGKTGGYRLRGGWGDKSVYEVVEALGEKRRLVKCLADKDCQRWEMCKMAKIWQRVEESFISELKKIKLSDL